MKTWAKILGVVAVLAVGVAVAAEVTTVTGINGIKFRLSEASWRYKMTVNVETPEGIKTGSAAREVTVKQVEPEIQGLYQTRTFVKGEAIAVDLGQRGVLFAIMGTDDYYHVFNSFPILDKGGDWTLVAKHYRDMKGAKAVLKPEQYPQIVMFKDMNDPKSVTLVKGWRFDIPTQTQIPVDNFEKIYGTGVKVTDFTIELTDDPVTWGIEKWLGWLPELHGSYLHGGTTSREAPLGLHAGHFKQGESQ
ncbi:MAG: hypothetical protein WBK77_06785 [Alphaproteobacteria bacterium]